MRLLIFSGDVGDWEIGDTIHVQEDGTRLGIAESMEEWVGDGRDPAAFEVPLFTVVDIPGLPLDLNLKDPQETVEDVPPEQVAETSEVVKRRAWQFDLTRFPDEDLAAVYEPGATVVTGDWAIRTLRRKFDDLAYSANESGTNRNPISAPVKLTPEAWVDAEARMIRRRDRRWRRKGGRPQ